MSWFFIGLLCGLAIGIIIGWLWLVYVSRNRPWQI